MFDDLQKNPKNQQGDDLNKTQISVQPDPADVPNQIEKIAEGQGPETQAVLTQEQPADRGPGMPEDIFAESEPSMAGEAPKPDILQPKEPPTREEQAMVMAKEEEQIKKINLKKMIILVGVALALIVIGAGGYFGYSYFLNSDGSGLGTEPIIIDELEDITPELVQPVVETAPAIVEPTQKPTPTPVPVPPKPKPVPPSDTDQDGLTDEEERRLGTNINSIDSDNDGLFDREEVEVYNTDPMNPDSDGDTYLDGQEVEAGYNPSGAGKLFDRKQ
ncbi:hypothetical protein ACFLZ9_00015 [Patescibacteria group bacterium]